MCRPKFNVNTFISLDAEGVAVAYANRVRAQHPTANYVRLSLDTLNPRVFCYSSKDNESYLGQSG